MLPEDAQRIASEIVALEDSFCNPMKLKLARELRDELAAGGLSPSQIDALIAEAD